VAELQSRLDAKTRQLQLQIELADRHVQIIHALDRAAVAAGSRQWQWQWFCHWQWQWQCH
jgi:hypothetical protein